MKRLPLPLSIIEPIHAVIDNTNDIGLANSLRNALRALCEYDYQDAIQILDIVNRNWPNVIDFKAFVKKIRSAEKRYSNT